MNRFFPLFAILLLANIIFVPAREVQAAYPTGWTYRQVITVDYTKVATNLTSFAVLVNFTNANLKSVANGGHVTQDDGGDIRFENASDVKLDHEIEKYVATNGNLIAWVEVDVLSSSVNTVINLYYGSTDPNKQWAVTNTWESSLMMVQHFKETSGGTNYDSTVNTNHGPIYGASLITAGQVDGADSFDGSDDYVLFTPSINFIPVVNSTTTISLWLKPSLIDPGNHANRAFTIARAVGSSSIIIGFANLTNMYVYDGTDIHNFSSNTVWNTWYHATLTYNGSQFQMYANGIADGSPFSQTLNAGDNTIPARIGTGVGLSQYFHGIIDEVRIYNRALSPGEILTRYNNQHSPSTFYSVGSEQHLNKGTIIKI